MKHELIVTADGSHTLYVPAFNEHYHSTNGAWQESLHVFIETGFRKVCAHTKCCQLHILEVGFGTGLNALLTFMEAGLKQVEVYYEAIEKYPLTQESLQLLNYAQPSDDLFNAIHAAEWNEKVAVATNPNRILCKRIIDLLDYQPDRQFDLIYFDAFAPSVQPELWSEAVFQKLYNALYDGGILVTYSSKGSVKEALRNAGFMLKRLPGAAGKRHMLRATKFPISD